MNEKALKNRVDMTSGPLFKKIVLFAIPIALSSILQLLFNAADQIVVGKFSGTESLAAVGSTSALISLIVNLFIGLSTGANATKTPLSLAVLLICAVPVLPPMVMG